MSSDIDGPTLGEVWRGLCSLRDAVAAMDARLAALRTDLSREMETQVDQRIAVLVNRLTRVERLVYGAVGLILTAVTVAVLSLVVH
jgi:hypothetical protein